MELKSILETILLTQGEPISPDKLAKITKAGRDEILKSLEELEKDYETRGFSILKLEDKFQLGSNPANSAYLENLLKSEFNEELSRAALETAAIIAYKGPLTRAQVEYVRGVNSSFIIRNLLIRGLVLREENPKDARSYIYRISLDFLKHLGLTKIEDLPQFEEFKKEKIEVLEEPI